MREVVFDTETTGFNSKGDDRLVEIGCVELINRIETGRTFHAYFNPEREMPREAFEVHGLSDAFLADKPLFASGVSDLLGFLGDAPLVAHNASFDFGFINAELARAGLAPIDMTRMIDTLAIAKVKHPGAKNSLDALCIRYGVDRSHRIKHGALLDAQLLSQIYVELTGGRQIGLELASQEVGFPTVTALDHARIPQPEPRIARRFMASAQELARHRVYIKSLTNPLWESDHSTEIEAD